jgi:hypothetical protein
LQRELHEARGEQREQPSGLFLGQRLPRNFGRWSPFSGCNPGAVITSVSWAVGSGSIPAGMSVLFDDELELLFDALEGLVALGARRANTGRPMGQRSDGFRIEFERLTAR